MSCHGTWIVHRDHTAACTIEGCSTPAEGHDLVITCTELEPGCRCLPDEDDPEPE
ncbi:MAG TPA: hypothetical protein VK053_06265 [Jiangellaceae bacterium]|nr:hypothetical protein [Jiangellaceae bacterium]